SNWPGRNRYIDVDLKNERWVFSFASDSPELDANPWSGGTGDFDLTSVDLQGSTCPFCSSAGDVKNTTLVVRTDSDDWSIESEGLVLTAESRGIINGAQVNTVKAASSRSVFEYVIQLPGGLAESETKRGFSLNFPGTASVFAQLPNGVARIQTSPKATAPVLLSGDAITTSDPAIALSMSSGNLVATVQGAAASLSAETDSLNVAIALPNGEIIQRQVEEGQSALKVESDAANGQVLIQQSTATGRDQLIAVNSAGEQKVLDVVVPLGPPSVVADLPVSLASKSNAELPPIEQRDTANPNYRTDSNYAAPKAEAESLASDIAASTTLVSVTAPVSDISTTTLVSSGNPAVRTAPPTESIPAVSIADVSTTSSTTTTLPPVTTTLPPVTTTLPRVTTTTLRSLPASSTTTTLPPVTTTLPPVTTTLPLVTTTTLRSLPASSTTTTLPRVTTTLRSLPASSTTTTLP
ncbi:MAG: hypothetical protein EBT73_06710, partial [Actinobacteria bacterium]|nr:hypothetical protein [Actinomycetota bacterium]